MDLSTHDEEIIISKAYAEFGSLATKGEQSILIAVARIRNSIMRDINNGEARDSIKTNSMRGGLFPQCAHVLRQTTAWQKISERERERMEQELLTLP